MSPAGSRQGACRLGTRQLVAGQLHALPPKLRGPLQSEDGEARYIRRCNLLEAALGWKRHGQLAVMERTQIPGVEGVLHEIDRGQDRVSQLGSPDPRLDLPLALEHGHAGLAFRPRSRHVDERRGPAGSKSVDQIQSMPKLSPGTDPVRRAARENSIDARDRTSQARRIVVVARHDPCPERVEPPGRRRPRVRVSAWTPCPRFRSRVATSPNLPLAPRTRMWRLISEHYTPLGYWFTAIRARSNRRTGCGRPSRSSDESGTRSKPERKSPPRRAALVRNRGGVRRGGLDLGEGFRTPPRL
jgi:hypothetical protein